MCILDMSYRLAVICTIQFFLLSSLGCNRESNRPVSQPQPAKKDQVTASTVLATIPDLLQQAPVQNLFQVTFNETGRAVAYIMESGGAVRAARNGRIGKPYQSIGAIALSPDGEHLAYSATEQDRWRMVIDDLDGPPVEMIGTPVFSPDSRHVAYEAMIGGKWHLIVDGNKSAPSPPGYNFHDKFFSSDSSHVISIELAEAIDKPVRVTVSDLKLTQQIVKEIPATDFVCNAGKTRMAMIVPQDVKKKVVEFSFTDAKTVSEGPPYDAVFQQTYGPDGVSLAYVAEKGGARYVVLNGREERLPYRDKIESLVLRPDNRGVGVILSSKQGYFLYEAFTGAAAKDTTRYVEAANLIYDKNGKRQAYIAKKGKDNIVLVVDGREGPAFDMIVTPMFSPDGTYLVYRARKDGKRFVVVADATGKILRQHPPFEMVYQPVLSADGRSIGYGVKDGKKLAWKVEKL